MFVGSLIYKPVPYVVPTYQYDAESKEITKLDSSMQVYRKINAF